MPSNRDITAITIRMWIRPPTLYTKAPKIHPITSIMAITYNKLLIKICLGE
jgi:hypothetical protein